MDLKTFKEFFMLKPKRTIIIDRWFELDGKDMLLLALTFSDEACSLWTLDLIDEDVAESITSYKIMPETIRESNQGIKMPESRSIESIRIGDHSIVFNGSSNEIMMEHNQQGVHKLQFFMDLGIDLSIWDEISLSRFQLLEHRNHLNPTMLDIEIKNQPIVLKFRPHHITREVFHKYSLEFDLKDPVELAYINPFEEKEESFYVNSFERFSYEKYVESIHQNDKYKDIPQDHLKDMMKSIRDYFDDLDELRKSVVLMTYEANTSLGFLSTAYLDSKIQSTPGKSTAAIAMMFRPDKEIGEHGQQLFIQAFQEVPNDKLDVIEFELHKISRKLPSETIVL